MRALLMADPPASHRFREALEQRGVEVVDVRAPGRHSALRPVPKDTDVVLALRAGQFGASLKEAARRAGARFLSLPPGWTEAEEVLRDAGILNGESEPVVMTIDTSPGEKKIAEALLAQLQADQVRDEGVAAAGRDQKEFENRPRVVSIRKSKRAESQLTEEAPPVVEPGIHTSPDCERLPPHSTCWEDASGMNRWTAPAPVAEPACHPEDVRNAQAATEAALIRESPTQDEPEAREPAEKWSEHEEPANEPAPEKKDRGAAARAAGRESVKLRHAAKMRDLRVMLTQRPFLSVERVQETMKRRYGSGISTGDIAEMRKEVQASLDRNLPPVVEQPAAAPVLPAVSSAPVGGDVQAAVSLLRDALKGSDVEQVAFTKAPDGAYKVTVTRTVRVVTVTSATEEL